MVDQFFSANQSMKTRNVSISQVYERYNLVSPDEANKSKRDGEGEDDESENLDESSDSSQVTRGKKIVKGVFG